MTNRPTDADLVELRKVALGARPGPLFQPVTVLNLLDEIAELRRERDEWEKWCREAQDDVETMTDAYGQQKARVKALEAERDEAVGRYEVRDADADCLSVKLDNALNEINRLKAQNP